MKRLLPFLIPLLVLLLLPFVAFAASLEVSKSSSFSTSDLNFSAGETVYVRVKTDTNGATHVLNVKDNSYSNISSVNLSKNGDSYNASFAAPSGEGYYSLEAKIEGDGASITSVKTIKVGSPSGANIKVNVNSSVKGTSSSQSRSGESKRMEDGSQNSESLDKSDESEDRDVSEQDKSDEDEVFRSEESQVEDKPNWIWATVKGVFSWLWPF